jgi:CheY-like chemotaxis protein
MSREGAPLVLVVDDFRDGREMYAEYLAHEGFAVAEAEDGEEAVAKARGLLPDVILMDLSLPGIDGWEATRLLKADPRTRHIRIIALTAHALSSYAESARAAGCDGVVTKPCLPPDLAAEVRRQLATAASGADLEESK